MLRTVIFVVFLVLTPSAVAVAPSAKISHASPDEAVASLVAPAAAMFDKGDYAGAAKVLQPLIERHEFKAASSLVRFGVFFLLGYSEAMAGDVDAGCAHIRNAGATGIAPPISDFWRVLAYCGSVQKNDLEYVEATIELVRSRPEASPGLPAELIFGAVAAARRLTSETETLRELLETLWRTRYTPTEYPAYTADLLWMQLAQFYAEEGEDVTPFKAAMIIPDVLAGFSFDNNFAEYAATAPVDEFEAATLAYIERLRSFARDNPRNLNALHALATVLRTATRTDEALLVADEAIARMRIADRQGTTAFDDESQYRHWIHNNRARTLWALGRWDEAVEEQKVARDASLVDSRDLVSQRINLGGMYVFLEQPELALEAIEGISAANLSIYGEMSAEAVRVCAHERLGDEESVAKSLVFMRAHAKDAFLPFKEALLCDNALDELAELLISRLDGTSAMTRLETLSNLQSYLLPELTPLDSELRIRFESVIKRAEVVEAIGRHGRILEWPAYIAFQ